ncbi:MAG: aspartate aminotransferase family protein [Oligoflexales bacterium]
MNIANITRTHGSRGDVLLRQNCGQWEVESHGSYVYGHKGGDYLDLGSFAVFLFGHDNPYFKKRIQEQLLKLNGTSRAMLSPPVADAMLRLASIAPKGLHKICLMNSGSEIVEAAIKIAVTKTGRSLLARMSSGYHGKTLGSLALTDCQAFREPCSDLIPKTLRLPRNDISKSVQDILHHRPAALFIEPIQGEGGIFEFSPTELLNLKQACQETGTLLIFDEIQCGLGRSGTIWASESSGILPDILLSGKALGGGMIAVSALMATPEAFKPMDKNPLLHSSTMAANPLACAAVHACVDILSQPSFLDLVNKNSSMFNKMLNNLVEQFPRIFIKHTGRGLMRGLHCSSAEAAAHMLSACWDNKLIVTPCLSTPEVLRITPTGVMKDKDFIVCQERIFLSASQVMKKNMLKKGDSNAISLC